MHSKTHIAVSKKLLAFFLSGAVIGTPFTYAQSLPGYVSQAEPSSPPPSGTPSGQALTQSQLGALVAPVALYPDSLLAQVLIASTYPLEVAEADSWLRNNAKLSASQREEAVKVQPWDNSVKSLIEFPDALNLMGKDLSWTQKLGDAYLAQPKELFQAVQTLREKAKNANTLKSGPQQVVTTETQSGQQVIVIQPANPQVIYVPTYNTYLVYGPWPYPGYYPPPFYPYAPSPGGMFFSFGVGLAVGAALWATPHWGSGSVVVNNVTYNNFNHGFNTPNNMGPNHYGNQSDWKYNPAHRDNVPYTNSALNNRFGNTNSGHQAATQAARQQSARNYWNQNATPQEKQNMQQARENAQKSWGNASAQQKQAVQNKARSVQNNRPSTGNNSRGASESAPRNPESHEEMPHTGFGGGERGGFRR